MTLRPNLETEGRVCRISVTTELDKVLIQTTTISKLYYDPSRPSAFSILRNLRSASVAATAKKKGKPTPKEKTFDTIRAWIEKQDVYMLHRPVRKRFVHNPYTVTNVMDVWE